jgi:hypothetical protein
LEYIGQLFTIEREATEAGDDPDQRLERRRAQAQPILDQIHAWCREKLVERLPRSPTAGAIHYVLKHWEALTRYLEDGRIAIDNNAAERALRPVTLGRKNWLFAGSSRGGDACAIAMSLISTAKAHGHDPLAYLTDVLRRLPGCSSFYADHRPLALLCRIRRSFADAGSISKRGIELDSRGTATSVLLQSKLWRIMSSV